MLVKDARDAARRWVVQEGRRLPGFSGAYFAGSTNWLADDAVLPNSSDVDVMVVLAVADPPEKAGKLIYAGVLLEISYISRDLLQSAESVLGDYHLAGGFRTSSVIADPSGQLTELQRAVALEHDRRHWVRRRCEHAADRVLAYARAIDETIALHDQASVTAFAAGLTTHVLLVAGLRNPTVRRRYAAVRELLADYGRLDFHEPLLGLLGCAAWERRQVEHHLEAVTAAFDTAKTVFKTPYRFGSDISDAARPISIDGSRELVALGLHREAVFWIVATYSRCRAIVSVDAPDLLPSFDDGYLSVLADLGIATFSDRQRRCREIEAFVPRVWQVAEEILSANGEIRE
jgi:hypothetical protein